MMNSIHPKITRREWLLWLALLSLALYLRGHDLNLTPIWGDMPNFVNTAAPITAGQFPLAGRQWSVGIDKAPLSIYLIAIPLFISQAPLFLIGSVALLNGAVVGGSYWFARRYFGRRAAAIAMLLFAVNPWSVHYIARVVWEPSLIPPFTLLFVAALFAAIVHQEPRALIDGQNDGAGQVASQRTRIYADERGLAGFNEIPSAKIRVYPRPQKICQPIRSRALILACVALACLFQIHPSTVPLAALLGITLLLFRRRWRVSALIGGISAAFVIMLPYIYHDYTLGFANARRLVHLATAPTAAYRQFDFYPARLAAIMATGLRYGNTIPHLEWLDYLTMGAVWGSAGYVLFIIWRNWRNDRAAARPYILLLLWFATPIVASLYRSVHLIPHYFIILQPAQFILIGIAAVELLRRAAKHRILVTGAVGVFAITIALQTYVSWRVPQHMAEHGVLQTAGMPLQFHLDLARHAARVAPDVPLYVIYDTHTSRAAARDLYACFRYVTADAVELRFAPQTLHIPAADRDLIFLLAPNQPVAAEILTTRGEEIAGTSVAALGGKEVFRFYRFPAAQLPAVRAELAPDAALAYLDNGVEILDCTFPQSVVAGAEIPVIATWRVNELTSIAPPDKGYTLFTHLLDYQQNLAAQKDLLVYASNSRAVGDITLNWYNLAIPETALPGRYHLALGMYTFPSQHRAHIVGGERAGENHLRLEPLTVHSAAYAPTRAELRLDHTLDWRVGDNIQLLGYNLAQRADGLRVLLYWQARAALDRDYTVFVHLLDASGQLRAQHDSQPQHNAYPTTAWQPGEIVEDAHVLTIPTDGAYHLVAGMYYWETGERLAVYAADGAPRGDSVPLKSNE